MLLNNLTDIKSFGFFGFEEIQSLMNNNCTNFPSRKGIYLVLTDEKNPEFHSESVGGYFKGKNPTVDISKLSQKWVNKSVVVYIGQAGGGTSKETLNDRSKIYVSLGKVNPGGYWGGRYFWRQKNKRRLKICLKSNSDDDPEQVEKSLIKQFKIRFCTKHFANINGQVF